MNKKVLFIPLVAFMVLAGIFATQLVRNQEGDDPTKLESVLVGKPVPEFHLEDLAERVSNTINRSLKASFTA